MYFTVYKTTNLVNGMFYIGKHQTKNPQDSYLGSGKYLQHAIKKYGRHNFKKEILKFCKTELEMNEAEKQLVIIDRKIAYNLLEGGEGSFSYINSNSEIAEKGRQKGRQRGKETLKNLKRGVGYDPNLIGKFPAPPQNILLMRIAALRDESRIKRLESFKRINHQQGKKNSQFGTCWITDGVINRKIKLENLLDWKLKGFHKGRWYGRVTWKGSSCSK